MVIDREGCLGPYFLYPKCPSHRAVCGTIDFHSKQLLSKTSVHWAAPDRCMPDILYFHERYIAFGNIFSFLISTKLGQICKVTRFYYKIVDFFSEALIMICLSIEAILFVSS